MKKWLKNKALALIKSSHSRVNLPWFLFNKKKNQVNKLHLSFYKKSSCSKTTYYLYLFFWPIYIFFACLITVFLEGKTLKKQKKITYSKQFKKMLFICLKFNFSPMYFYQFMLWQNEKNLNLYLQEFENIELQKKLTHKINTDVLTDKYKFSQFCIREKIPTPKIIAIYDNRKLVTKACLLDTYHEDIFIKPIDGVGGEGATLIRYVKSMNCWQTKTSNRSIHNIQKHCEGISQNSRILVQEKVNNHKHLNFSTKGALCTLRIVTSIQNGHSDVLFSTFRMPIGDSDIDNFGDGGIASNVIEGVLSAAISMKDPLNKHKYHPDSLLEIECQKIPFYNEALSLAKKAHEKLNGLMTIGWDIAITESGPSMIEGNPIWGTQIVQMTTGKPILINPMKEIYLSCLD